MPGARVEFHEAALKEIVAAETWYSERSPFASESFEACIDHALAFIAEHPLASPAHVHGTRRKVLLRFPFSLIYLIDGEVLLVLALAHQKRRPGYWRKRLGR